MALFVVRYTCNIIYHSFPVNSQYLITWGLDSPAKPGRHKIQFHEYAARLINPKNSLPPSSKILVWHRTAKLGSAWRSTVGITGNPRSTSATQRERESLELILTTAKNFSIFNDCNNYLIIIIICFIKEDLAFLWPLPLLAICHFEFFDALVLTRSHDQLLS